MMNRRFEANSPGFFSYYAKKISNLMSNPITQYDKGTHEWLQAKQTSNWATHMEEAHLKYIY